MGQAKSDAWSSQFSLCLFSRRENDHRLLSSEPLVPEIMVSSIWLADWNASGNISSKDVTKDKGQKQGRCTMAGTFHTASSVIQSPYLYHNSYTSIRTPLQSPLLNSIPPQHVCKKAELGTLLSPLPPLACHASSIKLHKSFASLSFNGK